MKIRRGSWVVGGIVKIGRQAISKGMGEGMVDFGTRDFGLRNPRSNGSLPRELFPLSSSFSLLFIQPRFSPFSKPSMLVDDSLSFPFHFALYRRALLLPLPALHRRYFILTASLRRAVIVIIKKKENNEMNEKREKPTSPPPRRKSTMASDYLCEDRQNLYRKDWLVPDNFRDDISQLHDSQPLIRIMARLKKHFEMPRAIWSRDFVSAEIMICKGFSGINNHNANALQDCDIWRKIIAGICII